MEKVIIEEALWDDGPIGTITVERRGQQEVSDGDGVVVQWEIALPTEEGCVDLEESLRFGQRVTVDGEALGLHWGCGSLSGDQRTRVRGGYQTADTWARAFREAESYCRGELAKLTDALKARAHVSAV